MGMFRILVLLSVLMTCILASDVLVKNGDKSEPTERLAKIEATLEQILERNERLEKRVAALEEENEMLTESLEKVLKHQSPHDEHAATRVSQTGENRHKHHGGRTRHGIVSALNVPLKPRRRQLAAATVAFTAVVSPPSLPVGPGQTVVYDSVITNVGGAYNSQTGVFTAPVSGVYAFNFAEMVDPGQNEYLELMKDGYHVMWNFGHALGASHLASSSRTATVEVNKGSQVWVRTKNNGQHGTGNIHGNSFTTFSGWAVAFTE